MRQAVIDASVLMHRYLLMDRSDEADMVLRTYEPVLLTFLQIECTNVFRTYVKHGHLDLSHAQALLEHLQSSFEFVESEGLLPRALDLAALHDHSVYDCLYVSLSQVSDIPLATADNRLARKFGSILNPPIINLHDMPASLP